MKNFLVINPLRCASRAFYLNLTAQNIINVPSRILFDALMLSLIKELSEANKKKAIHNVHTFKNSFPQKNFGLVFHDIRSFFITINILEK